MQITEYGVCGSFDSADRPTGEVSANNDFADGSLLGSAFVNECLGELASNPAESLPGPIYMRADRFASTLTVG